MMVKKCLAAAAMLAAPVLATLSSHETSTLERLLEDARALEAAILQEQGMHNAPEARNLDGAFEAEDAHRQDCYARGGTPSGWNCIMPAPPAPAPAPVAPAPAPAQPTFPCNTAPGYGCSQCHGRDDRNNPEYTCQTNQGRCGTCYLNACLTSPNYSTSFDRDCNMSAAAPAQTFQCNTGPGHYCGLCVGRDDRNNTAYKCRTNQGRCGTCYLNACLTSPNYSTSFDRSC